MTRFCTFFTVQETAAKYLAALKIVVDNCETSMYMIGPLYNMKTIGSNYPEALMKYKDYFENLKKDAALKDYAVAALDVIAGRRYNTYFNQEPPSSYNDIYNTNHIINALSI